MYVHELNKLLDKLEDAAEVFLHDEDFETGYEYMSDIKGYHLVECLDPKNNILVLKADPCTRTRFKS